MNQKYVSVVIGLVAVLALVFIVLQHQPSPVVREKLHVATSFYPLYFFAQAIGGDKAEVTNITPAGAEPHDYEPTPQDVATIGSSRLLILNGGGLEAWGSKVLQNIDVGQTLVVTAGEGLTNQQVVEEGQTIIDPHVWLAPPLAESMVDKITQAFVQADPGNTLYYQRNSATLKAKLQDLDAAYQSGLAHCAQHNIITSHAAFGYLASTYHLHQVPIGGLSPDAEPSSKQLGEVADFARKNNVKVIFFESLVSPKLSETIATEVGAQTMVLNPIEGLSDSELAHGKTYLTEMQSNLANLEFALQCKA